MRMSWRVTLLSFNLIAHLYLRMWWSFNIAQTHTEQRVECSSHESAMKMKMYPRIEKLKTGFSLNKCTLHETFKTQLHEETIDLTVLLPSAKTQHTRMSKFSSSKEANNSYNNSISNRYNKSSKWSEELKLKSIA